MTSKMSDGLKKTLGMIGGNGEAANIFSTFNPNDNKLDTPLVRINPTTVVSKFETISVPSSIIESSPDKTDLRDDYLTSRNITHALINYAGNALEGALQVAIESQHPKAYEMFDRLANTMRGLSKDLLEAQKTYQSIIDIRAGKIANNITQNNITINPDGESSATTTNTSMSDIVKMIKKFGDKTTLVNIAETEEKLVTNKSTKKNKKTTTVPIIDKKKPKLKPITKDKNIIIDVDFVEKKG